MMGVPANYLFMAQEPAFAEADLSSLRLAVVGGAPMPVALLEVWARRAASTSSRATGSPRRAPNVLCLPPEDARRKAGYAGKPYPVRRRATSRQKASCSSAGPNVFAGYWRNPEATADAFRDGWLLTGDVAERDDEGNYRIRGRLKDMFVSGGENVYPAEIEVGAARASRGRTTPPWSACRTSGGARSASRSSCSTSQVSRGRATRALPCPPRALQGAEARSRSSTSCRATRWARSRSPSWPKVTA